MPILHSDYCLLAPRPARPAFAWEQPVGSPPGWHSQWVQTVDKTQLFAAATDDAKIGEAPPRTYFRVDAPALMGRLWVYNPLNDGWAWLPRASTTSVDEPTLDQVRGQRWARVIRARLPVRTRAGPGAAAGLHHQRRKRLGPHPAQSAQRRGRAGSVHAVTWATTPQGQLGLSPYDPLVSIDAAIWLAQTRGWTQWQVYTAGNCR